MSAVFARGGLALKRRWLCYHRCGAKDEMASAPKLKTSTRIGPGDHGRRMSLDEFAPASAEPGYVYELENGVIVVDVPGVPHQRVREFVREELALCRRKNPSVINMVAEGSGHVVRAWASQSERHPDLSIYLSPPPRDDPQPWDEGTPDIVIEIVSKSSGKRDYERKPKDYLAVGVRQYWILDPLQRNATVMQRRGDLWTTKQVGQRGSIRTTLSPGFVLKLPEVFNTLRRS